MDLLFMSADPRPEAALPALGLLAHSVRVIVPDFSALVDVGPVDVVIVDARTDLGSARGLCRVLAGGGTSPVLTALFQEGGLVALSSDWGIDDFFLASIGPAELDARLRLLRGRAAVSSGSDKVTLGELVIDEGTYTARLRGKTLDLTYKEFELLKYLCQHAGRVFTRAQLLQEVWGYDFFGGTRTVDVHVRRLRAKLGPEYEALIGTVRNVGYKAVRPNVRSKDRRRDDDQAEESAEESEAVEQAAR
ncbi:putative two component transcriptional regulator, winged helix family [Segniliparus rotundus DSM 44985]|uniref:Putative two component transcriptional regulator, winged helix family n=1 Tax=Segniliparus rotundus (strain ATCC BAA-972 / CDC 1076 / CIP 108378 / DSM 44985 / JCM 13578) TaxID=640132 RepID=D6ZEJ6_SEGRD|nr:response regulator transcription factor [Segniliparus rotundus]ADG99472.1 putative two component transcriptional regulator, winged helix family [Segniliparus rotundus DSM 44985]